MALRNDRAGHPPSDEAAAARWLATPSRGAFIGVAAPAIGRWAAADATRGFAMLLVCLSHFLTAYFKGRTYSVAAGILEEVTKAATPTFLLLSGTMVGMAHADRRVARSRAWLRSVDRGLFLLLVARPLIFLAHVPIAGGVWRTTRWMFSTDTIAVCLIVGPAFVLALRPAARTATAGALYAASWWGVVATSASGATEIAKEILVGDLHRHAMAYTFPVLQWLSFFVVGTAVGERLRAERLGGPRYAARFALRAGLASVALALGGYAVHLVARPDTLAWILSAPAHKAPPAPAFLLFYGGAALVVLAVSADAERRGALARCRAVLALLGRNSLFAFVFQYFVYAAVFLARGSLPGQWSPWFAASFATVLGATALWERARGYRWITVGLRHRTPPRMSARRTDGAARAGTAGHAYQECGAVRRTPLPPRQFRGGV